MITFVTFLFYTCKDNSQLLQKKYNRSKNNNTNSQSNFTLKTKYMKIYCREVASFFLLL